jgi:arylsulfatase A-like enzyme
MRVLVLEACGLHTGYLGCYGNDWVATPNLDRLAAKGIVFDQHIVDRPTLTVGGSLLARSAGSGRYACGQSDGPRERQDIVALPGGIRCRHHLCPTFEEMGQLAAHVRAWPEDCPVLWVEGPSLVPPWSPPEDMLGIYGEDEEDEEASLPPWADPPRGPVELTPDDALRLQDTYAAVVTYWDALLGNLLEDLRTSGRIDELVVCVTARAGLPLGEHGQVGVAAPPLHDELVHVPLILRLPHTSEAGLRISALTQPVDLLPTFGELVGMPGADVQGSSLRPLVLGKATEVRPYACAELGGAWLLRTPEWAFHVPPAPADPVLFAKPDDRWEVSDVRPRQGELAERLHATLHAFIRAVQQPGPLVYPPLLVDEETPAPDQHG